jgi:hypothetical protein
MGLPIPPMDFLLILIDVLAKRYGWSYSEITENMFWEHVYAMYEYASNLESIEKNEEMKFNYMLHAQSKKALDGWRDMAIPFPDKSIKARPTVEKSKQSSALKTLPTSFRSKVIPTKVPIRTPKQEKALQEKLAYIRKRIIETQEKANKLTGSY